MAQQTQGFWESMGELLENIGKAIFGEYTPNNNATNPHWEPGPTHRGTFDILSACIVTPGLCVSTAIHLNIPKHDEGMIKVTMRKIGWLVLGLLSPELVSCQANLIILTIASEFLRDLVLIGYNQVLYIAFLQYRKAKFIVKVMNSDISNSPSKTSSWKAMISWFARLGRKDPDDDVEASCLLCACSPSFTASIVKYQLNTANGFCAVFLTLFRQWHKMDNASWLLRCHGRFYDRILRRR